MVIGCVRSSRVVPSGEQSCAPNIRMWVPCGACERLVVPVKHAHPWVPVHMEGITVSTEGLRNLNTLFKQFLSTGKYENHWTQNRSRGTDNVSSPLQKTKVLASDSGTQELNFDVCLKLCREVLIFHFREKTYGVRSGWQPISTTTWRLKDRVPVLPETLELITAITQKGAHHRRAC